jgi:hypothetical protein
LKQIGEFIVAIGEQNMVKELKENIRKEISSSSRLNG